MCGLDESEAELPSGQYRHLVQDIGRALASLDYLRMNREQIKEAALLRLRDWCRTELICRAREVSDADERADALRLVGKFAHETGCSLEEVEKYLTEAHGVQNISHDTRRVILRTRIEVLGSPFIAASRSEPSTSR